MARKKSCVFIAGGGTGGHVYPALAIGEAIEKKHPEVQVHFIGTPRGIENKVIPPKGYPLHLLSVGRLNGVSIFEKLKTLFLLPFSFLKALGILLKYRPKTVIGVGGYASAPVLLMASICGIDTSVWEPNAYPGMTNRWLARWVSRVFIVFEQAEKYLKAKKILRVGIPLRYEIEKGAASLALVSEPKETKERRPLRVLIFGGSQGARGINRVVVDCLTKAPVSWLQQFEFVHQTGRLDFSEIKKQYSSYSMRGLEVLEYLDDMPHFYQWADVVICRAGASTVAELACLGKASWLIPFPGASDGHQQKNAESLKEAKAAKMTLQKDFSVELVKSTLQEWARQPAELVRMQENIKHFYRPRAAEKISDIIWKDEYE